MFLLSFLFAVLILMVNFPLDVFAKVRCTQSGDLIAQVEAFKEFTGHYPESVHVDQIYRTISNRAWCKERGIRMSGPPLGRRPAHVSKATDGVTTSLKPIANKGLTDLW